jgi:hypothetical protein
MISLINMIIKFVYLIENLKQKLSWMKMNLPAKELKMSLSMLLLMTNVWTLIPFALPLTPR